MKIYKYILAPALGVMQSLCSFSQETTKQFPVSESVQSENDHLEPKDKKVVFDASYVAKLNSNAELSQPVNKSLTVGRIEGVGGVSPTGAANYTIPIEVAPGTAGIQPNLSVVYNSMGGNGILGYGWNLSGLSAITRAPQTIYHNGKVRAVDFDDKDAFTLDGNRLIPQSGSNGKNGTTYYTESETYSRITSIGRSGNSPASFKVETKDGTTIEYGKVSGNGVNYNASYFKTGSNTIASWHINRIADSYGNYMTFEYLFDNDGFRIKYIKYTGNSSAGMNPYNQVNFYYQKRDDEQINYKDGVAFTNKLILKEIENVSEGRKVRCYQFKYGKGSYGLYSFLNEIVERSGSGEKLNATKTQYHDFSGSNIVYEEDPALDGIRDVFSGDFNGDGKSDLLRVRKGTNSEGHKSHTSWSLYYSTNNGFKVKNYENFPSNSLISSNNPLQLYNGDFNGDGLSDMVVLERKTHPTQNANYEVKSILYYLADPSSSKGFRTVRKYPANQNFKYGVYKYNNFIQGDFDGDGIQDLLGIFYNMNLGAYKGFIYFLNKNESVEVEGIGGVDDKIVKAEKVFTVDHDGDGKQEVLALQPSGASLIYGFKTSGNKIERFIHTSTDRLKGSDKLYPGDFNGDGLTDYLRGRGNSWKIVYSRGSSVTTNYFTFSNRPLEVVIGDYNGDGKSDVLAYFSPANNCLEKNFDIYYSNGVDFKRKLFTKNTKDYCGLRYLAADVNGDGQTDIIAGPNDHAASPIQNFYFSPSDDSRLLSRIQDGFKFNTDFTYEPLTSNAIYKKGSSAKYPVYDVQPALKVVRTMITPSAVGTNFLKTFSYEGAQIHGTGKGFLGFKKLIIRLNAPSREIVEEYELERKASNGDNLYGPQLLKRKVYTGSTKILEENYTYTNNGLGKKRFASFAKTTHSKNFLTTEERRQTFFYNSDGNLKKVSEIVPNISVSITDNTFIQSGGWLPSKLRTSKIKRSDIEGGDSFEEYKIFSYTNKGGLNHQETNYSNNKRVYTSYTRDSKTGMMLEERTSVTGESARKMTYAYDNKWRFVRKEVNEEGHTIRTTFDGRWGVPLTITSPTGLVTKNQYDDFGTLVKTNHPDGTSTKHTTFWENPDNDGGNDDPTRVTNATYSIYTESSGNPSTQIWYDKLGRERKSMVRNFNGEQVYTVTAYNYTGQIETTTSPFTSSVSPVISTYRYTEGKNELASISNSAGETKFTYQFSGIHYKIITTAPDGVKTYKKYDAAGRVYSSYEDSDMGGRLIYKYNARNQIKEVRLKDKWVTRMTYDDFGNQKSLIDRNSGTTNYVYNGFGELKSQTDANGNTYSMVYDKIGRISKKTGPEGSYTYEYVKSGRGLGQIKEINGPEGINQSAEYDEYNRLVLFNEDINGESFRTRYAYDEYGRQRKLTYPSGFIVRNVYNRDGYLSEVKGEAGGKKTTLWVGQKVNEYGSFTQYTNGHENPITFKRTYDKYGYPKNLKATKDERLFEMAFNFNVKNGNLTTRTDVQKNLSERFEYDNLYRLKRSKVGTSSSVYVNYHSNGNIKDKTGLGKYSYDNSKVNALVKVENSRGLASSLTQRINYTSFNKVKQINENNQYINFSHGPDEQRKKVEWLNGRTPVKDRFYTTNYEKEVEHRGSEREIHYITGGSGLVALYVIENGKGTYYFPQADYLGSILEVFDKNGSTVAEQSFDSWGRRRNPSNWTYNNVPSTPKWLIRGFTGHEHLDENGLINMNGRMYDPLLGRMLSPDNYIQNSGFTQNYNRYSYAYNNPLKFTDPDGDWAHIAVGALIGGAVNLATNWNNIDNFWEGAAAFGAGAGSGALTAAFGPAGAFTGGLLTGGTNSTIAQTGNGTNLDGVNWGQVGLNAGVGGIAGIAGFGAGQLASKNLGGIVINGLHVSSNSALGGAVTGMVGGAVGGYAGGFTGGLLMTGNISGAHEAGISGLWMGAGIGAGAGAIGGYTSAKEAGLNPWTGRPNKSVVIGEGQRQVNKYAKDLRAETISKDWPSDVKGYVGKEINSNYTTKEGVQFNGKYIELKMQNDYYFYDLGSKGAAVQSPYYNIEVGRTMIYPKVYNITHIRHISTVRIIIFK